MTKRSELEAELADALADIAKLEDRVSELENENADLHEENSKFAADDYALGQAEEALETIRGWMLDFLYHDKEMRDPHEILQLVEDALQ